MTDMHIGINLEFVRHADKSFEYGGQRAAEMGYRYIEPCFLMGTCLLSNSGYCHIRSLDMDPQYFKDFCQQHQLKISVVHVHAKDISIAQSDAERGKVDGTAVGCACGGGVIDWRRIVAILRTVNYQGVLSAECGTESQAADSLKHLQAVLAEP